MFTNARGLGAKCHETERDGLVLGAPREMAVEGDGEMSWRGVDEVVAVVGLHVCKHKADDGAGDQKNHETERNGSISGAPCETMVEGDGERWWGGANEVVMVVGLRTRKHEAGEGLGAKCHETECDGSISGALHETAV
jgi:hypothetical protein